MIYAPLNGMVTSLFPTNHEIGIRTKEGLDLLIHLGLNTVELGGVGCDILVEAGQEVKKGQLLATMNRKLLRGLGYDDTVIVTYTNDQILKGVSAPVFFREINAKRAVQTISYHSRLRLNKLGFILQAYNLVPYLTVKEQFQLVDKVKKTGNLRQEELKDLLADLGIENLVKKYPENLSGGQKQRVAIARAMYANPKILLADEPTASLDSERVEEVGRLFKKLAKDDGKAIILVTHDPRLEKYADHIYDMMDGQLSQRK